MQPTRTPFPTPCLDQIYVNIQVDWSGGPLNRLWGVIRNGPIGFQLIHTIHINNTHRHFADRQAFYQLFFLSDTLWLLSKAQLFSRLCHCFIFSSYGLLQHTHLYFSVFYFLFFIFFFQVEVARSRRSPFRSRFDTAATTMWRIGCTACSA